MKVSVVIPAYNEEKYIGKCLDSLVGQLEEGDEVIVIDNNSSDNTAAISKEFKGVRVVKERTQGYSYARNKGFNVAKNKIIARTDADSVVAPDWLSSVRSFFEYPNKDMVAVTGPTYLREFNPVKLGVHGGVTKKRLGKDVLVGPNEALARVLWKKIEYFLSNNDKDLAEDVEMSIGIYKVGGSIEFLNSMVVYTSARRMIRNPIKSYRIWKKKLDNTLKLVG